MNHRSQVARGLRSCAGGRLTETDTFIVRHFNTCLHVISMPDALQADPLFSRFYTGQRRTAARYSSKESHFKDGCVHLVIDSRDAAHADDAFQRFMAPMHAAAKSALHPHLTR